MILTDRQIRKAIQDGHLLIEPKPEDDQFSPTALDLHIGDDFRQFQPKLYGTKGVQVSFDLDEVQIPDPAPYMEPLPAESNGTVILRPKQFVIATTLERLALPSHGKLAARVEGRSRFARLGLVIHMTAPTIHNSFQGKITLEIMNHGPISLRVTPRVTRLCQLIFERVEEIPGAELVSPFQGQQGPLGSLAPRQ